MTIMSVMIAMGWIRFSGKGKQSDLEMVGDFKNRALLAEEKRVTKKKEAMDLRRRRAEEGVRCQPTVHLSLSSL